MDRVSFFSVLQEQVELIPTGSDTEYRTVCPICSNRKKKFYINIEKQTGHCKHCNYSPNFYQIMTEMCGLSHYELRKVVRVVPKVEAEQKKKEINYQELPDGFMEFSDTETDKNRNRVLEYALSRFYIEDIKTYRMGTASGKFVNYLIFPVYQDGKLVSYQARNVISGARMRYFTPKNNSLHLCLYNYDVAKQYTSCILVEGIADQIAAGFNAVALFSSSLSKEQLERLSVFKKEITVVMDSPKKDKDSLLKTKRICGQLKTINKNILVVFLPDGDPGNYTKNKAELKSIIGKKAVSFDSYDFLSEEAKWA